MLGISPSTIDEWSISDIYYANAGLERKAGIDNRVHYETARWINFIALKTAGAKGIANTPQKWMPFAWENVNRGLDNSKWTKEKIEAFKNSKFYQNGKKAH